MAQVKQKEAVVNAVKSVLGHRFDVGSNAKSLLSDNELDAVRQHVLNGITGGEVEFSKDRTDTAAVTRYVNGMVDNHLRKSKELNGGKKYVPERRNSKTPAQANGVDTSVLPKELADALNS